MHKQAHHTHVLRRENFMDKFYPSCELQDRKGKLVLHNPDWEVHPHAKKFKHVDEKIVFIRNKKKLDERGERARIRLLNAMLPNDGELLAKRKN